MALAHRLLLGARDLGVDPIAIEGFGGMPVVWTGLATLIGMLAFEATKQFLFPHINLWQSHTLTIAFTTTLAVVVAVAVRRRSTRLSHALEERIRLAALMADVGLALNRHADLGDCLHDCTEALVRHLGAAFARVWTVNRTGDVLELQASAGMYTHIDGLHRRIPVGQFKIGRIAHDRRPLLTNQVVGDPDVHDQGWAVREGMVAFAGHPLIDNNRVVGVMALFARHRLSDDVMTALGSVANHIALGITRHQAEGEQRLLARIVEDSDDAILSKTLDGVILTWNTGAESLYGYTAAEAVGQPMSLIVPPDRAHEVSMLLEALRLGKHLKHYETLRRRRDGSDVWVSVTVYPIKDRTGQIIAGSAIAHDISRRRRADEQIRLLARAMESTNEMISVTDLDHRFTFVNRAFLSTYGYSTEEVIGHTPVLLRSPDTPEALVKTIQRETLAGGWRGELLHRRKDGADLFVSLNTSVIRAESGQVIGLLGVARDVSERLHAERALREAQERMRFALEASRVGVWEGDLKAGRFYWSDLHEAMHGLAPGTYNGTLDALFACIHADDRDQVRNSLARVRREHLDETELEYRTIWPDLTEHWIRVTAHYSYDDAGALVRGAGVAVDVTERRLLEGQLRQAQKMDAVGQLAGGIAHDFNNVLTAILGYAEFVFNDLPDDDPRRTDVDEIRKAGRRAATLTRQLLAFSRKQILTLRVLHLGDVVSAIVPMLRRLVGEAIDLRTMIGDRAHVNADAGQMEQVLVNLVVNARDAMREGGRLTIETADVSLDATYARQHPSVRPGPHVMVAVSDTGHGMDPATQKRVFEPFFTTKPHGQGTGLGLATVYGIVKQSGGHVWVYSEVGRGTAFKVYLPQTQEAEEVGQAAPVDVRTLRGSETILVVEDEDSVREFVDRVLSWYGYNVRAAADPQRAIELVKALDGAIDVIVTDVVLPGMSGRAMVSLLQQRLSESKVLYISGYTDNAIVHHGVLDPDMWFLQKPFSGEALAEKVREILDTPGPHPEVSLSGHTRS